MAEPLLCLVGLNCSLSLPCPFLKLSPSYLFTCLAVSFCLSPAVLISHSLTLSLCSLLSSLEEEVENFDVSSLQEEALRNIEADSFWCMSKLLDGIQVSMCVCVCWKDVGCLRINFDQNTHIQFYTFMPTNCSCSVSHWLPPPRSLSILLFFLYIHFTHCLSYFLVSTEISVPLVYALTHMKQHQALNFDHY